MRRKSPRHWLGTFSFWGLALLAACTYRQSISSVSTAEHFTVEVWSSTNCALSGETVTVRATVTNVGSQTQLIDLKDQVVFDLVVADQNGEHRWSAGKPLTADLTRLELVPKQSKMLEMQWVVQPLTSVLVVTAQLIDNPKDPRGPINAQVRIPSLCPGY